MPLDPSLDLIARTAAHDVRTRETGIDLGRRVRRLEGSARLSSEVDGSWKAAALVNGFGAGPNAPPAYYKDAAQRVYLRGTPTVPAAGGRPLTIFALAEGYGPVYVHRFVCAGEFADSIAEVIVDVVPSGVRAGLVQLSFSGFNGQQVNLDVISFRTI